MMAPRRFRFLNEERDIDLPGEWNDAGARKLWLYHLHYFDDLNAFNAKTRSEWHVDLIRRWIGDNPPTTGIGWEAYPTSLRIVNWVKWALSGGSLPMVAIPSLAVQARWLDRRVETHLLGNHLFANAKALILAGCFFEGGEAERWMRKGLELLRREIPEQVFRDGGHFERSPMYHSIILEDVLDLINVARVFDGNTPRLNSATVDQWSEIANRMRRWLKIMCHPDGEIALFNDAAIGIAPTPLELDTYGIRLGLGPVASPENALYHLAESGYVRAQNEAAVLLLDVGLIGPDYLPAHGHADTFTFELSLRGRRVVVDTGVSGYDAGPQRLRERGTGAHNTVVVDDQDSSEVWGNFRVARRAKTFDLTLTDIGGVVEIACSHDGYRRLKDKITHRRAWRLREDGLCIDDRLLGKFGQAESRLLLHPEITAMSGDKIAFDGEMPSGEWLIRNGSLVRWKFDGGKGRYERAEFHPGFGKTLPTARLVCRSLGTQIVLNIEWN